MNNDVDDLRRSLGRVQSRVDEIQQDRHEVSRRVTEFDDQLEMLRDQVWRADERAAGADSLAGDLAAKVNRLTAEVDWMAHALTAWETRPERDLDAIDADTSSLLERIDAAAEARASFAAPAEVERWERDVKHCEELETEHGRAFDDVRKRSREILDACAGDGRFTDQDGLFRKAAVRFESADRKLAQVRAQAVAAEKKLNDNHARRKDAENVLADGDAALGELRHDCRVRLERALSDRAPLPFWFTATFRHVPSPGQAEPWASLGADVIVYRIRYRVTDLAVALGSPPDTGSTRRESYEKLVRRVDEIS